MATESSDEAQHLISWHDVSRSHVTGRTARTVLDVPRLVVEPGEFVAVTGPSGSGKSTMLNLLGLIDRPTSGTRRMLGRDVERVGPAEHLRLRRRVAFLFQQFHLLGDHTVMENVALPQRYRGVAAATADAAAAELVARLGLSGQEDTPAGVLSGGEQQRVALARALATDPVLLLCDEPTGNLDAANATQVLRLLQEANGRGVSVVLVTHDQALAARAGTRYTMAEGRITE